MNEAIGFVEFKTVSTGVLAADDMVKTSSIKIIEAKTVCPGKYIVLFKGKLGEVKAALEKGITKYENNVIGSFVLGNPHNEIFSAIEGTSFAKKDGAVAILETFTAYAIIVAADIAAKTSHVKLVEIRIARGMCGKSFMIISGELAAVNESINAAVKNAAKDGEVLDYSIIPNPDDQIWDSIL